MAAKQQNGLEATPGEDARLIQALYSQVIPRHLRPPAHTRPRTHSEPGARSSLKAGGSSACLTATGPEVRAADIRRKEQKADDGRVTPNIQMSSDDDGDENDGYCGVRTDSAALVTKGSRKADRDLTHEFWCPFSRQQTSEKAASQTEDFVGKRRSASLHDTRHPPPSSPASVDFRQRGRTQSQLAIPLTDSPSLHTQRSKVDLMSMEEGCRLVFPHTVPEEADRQLHDEHVDQSDRSGDESDEDMKIVREIDREKHVSATDSGSVCGEGSYVDLNTSFNSDTIELLCEQETSLHSLSAIRTESKTSLSSLQDAVPSHEDELQQVSVLQSCAACHSSSRELTVMQCFHVVCAECMLPCCEDTVQCGVCKSQQARPQEGGVTVFKDILPMLFHPGGAVSDADHTDLSTESRDSHSQKTHEFSKEGITAGVSSDSETCQRSANTIQRSLPVHCAISNEETQQGGREASASVKDTLAQSLDDEPRVDKKRSDVTETEDQASGLINSEDATSTLSSEGGSMGEQVRTNVCGACGTEADLQHMCVTCGGVSLCAGCHAAHRTLLVTRNHEVRPISLSVSPLTLLTHHRPLCPHHGQELTLQCCTCAVLLCHCCRTPQHVQHEVRDLGSVVHSQRKEILSLQRSVKQHVLLARSAGRAVKEQQDRVHNSRQLCQRVRDTAQKRAQRLMAEAEKLIQQIESKGRTQHELLARIEDDVMRVQGEGHSLRCLLSSVIDAHLTNLIVHANCQARFDKLRRSTSLQVKEMEEMAFCPAPGLGAQPSDHGSLGTVRTVAISLPTTAFTVMAIFHTTGEVSSMAVTPYNELLCVSSACRTCQMWDQQGAMLCDVSRHVTDPCDVQVTPSGILILLGADVSRTDCTACLTFLSPSGSLLGRVPLSSHVRHTHIHCPDDWRLLVSDGMTRTLTLYAVNDLHHPTLTVLRRVSLDILQNPCHVTQTLTGDWMVNDQGFYLRLVSPEDHVATVLSDDEPVAAMEPPRRSCYGGPHSMRRRKLCGVSCDSRGRMVAADSEKNGMYIATSSPAGNGECHFVSLRELTAVSHVTALAIDNKDHIILGMSDGGICILKLNHEEED